MLLWHVTMYTLSNASVSTAAEGGSLRPGCYFVSLAETACSDSIQCNTYARHKRDKAILDVILSIYCMAAAACYLASPGIGYKRLLRLLGSWKPGGYLVSALGPQCYQVIFRRNSGNTLDGQIQL